MKGSGLVPDSYSFDVPNPDGNGSTVMALPDCPLGTFKMVFDFETKSIEIDPKMPAHLADAVQKRAMKIQPKNASDVESLKFRVR